MRCLFPGGKRDVNIRNAGADRNIVRDKVSLSDSGEDDEAEFNLSAIRLDRLEGALKKNKGKGPVLPFP